MSRSTAWRPGADGGRRGRSKPATSPDPELVLDLIPIGERLIERDQERLRIHGASILRGLGTGKLGNGNWNWEG
jgi:hypothetical protein